MRAIVWLAPLVTLALTSDLGAQEKKVSLLRVPHSGIQPQAVRDDAGNVHLLYFHGEPAHGDVFYVRSKDEGATFSRLLRVNDQPGSVIAVGNIRGAHLALGKDGRAHVAWMGSRKAQPQAAHKEAPMLYARLNDEGTAFEPQRNLIQSATGLDGGGSLAADSAGNVYVAWHAPKPGGKGEEDRRVWVRRSTDEGKTFSPEKPASDDPTGVCGCCGMRAFADPKGLLFLMYRSAKEQVHRDTYLLVSKNKGASFSGENLHAWNVGSCPMSSFALATSRAETLAAWETDGQVYFASIDPAREKKRKSVAAPGVGKKRKHPVVAGNGQGEIILVWTEGMGWDQGGSLVWQVYDKDGKPNSQKGRADGVPKWSLVAVFANGKGGFTVVY